MPSQWSLRRVAAAGFVLLGVVFVGFLLFKTYSVLLSILIGILVGWGLKQPVAFLVRHHLPRALALALVILILLALIPIAIFLVIPLVSNSLTQVWNDLLPAIEKLAGQLPSGLTGTSQSAAASSSAVAQQVQKYVADHAGAIAGGVMEVGSSVIGLMFDLITILLIAVLWMSEEDDIRTYALSYLPAARRPTAETLWLDMEQQLGGYVRGLVVLMFMVGIGCGLGYMIQVFWQILMPDTTFPDFVLLPAAIGEIGICLWLLVAGVRKPQSGEA